MALALAGARFRVRGGLVLKHRLAVGGIRPLITRILDRLDRRLRLVRQAALAAGDLPQLGGVLLEAVGAAALVDQLPGLVTDALQVHGAERTR